MSMRGVWLRSLVILPLLAGCGRQGLHPVAVVSPPAAALEAAAPFSPGDFTRPAQGRSLFFPLHIGNHWHYSVRFAEDFVYDGSETGWTESRDSIDARLERVVVIDGRDYVDEARTRGPAGTAGPYTMHIYLRQDHTGLYEADVVGWNVAREDPLARAWSRLESRLPDAGAREAFRAARARLERKLSSIPALRFGPFAAPPGLPPSTDLTRLSYPLHPGAQWVIRADPLFAAEAQGFETVSLPAGRFPAWRIRYTSVLYGPRDVVHVWYGQDGYLALIAHLESEGTDSQGNPRGTLISEYSERLDRIDLVGERGRP